MKAKLSSWYCLPPAAAAAHPDLAWPSGVSFPPAVSVVASAQPSRSNIFPSSPAPLLSWTLDALTSAPIDGIVLVVAPDDAHVDSIDLPRGVRVVRRGGATRAASVMAGLDALGDVLEPRDLVLVHDAARPCIDAALVGRLLEAVANHADGGLLALPVADTVKRSEALADAFAANRTEDRSRLWLAQTPQAFPYERLRSALRAALSAATPSPMRPPRSNSMAGAPCWFRARARISRSPRRWISPWPRSGWGGVLRRVRREDRPRV